MNSSANTISDSDSEQQTQNKTETKQNTHRGSPCSTGGGLLGQVLQHGDPAEGGAEPHPVSDPLQRDQPAAVGVLHARVAGGHPHGGPRPPAEGVPGGAQVHFPPLSHPHPLPRLATGVLMCAYCF